MVWTTKSPKLEASSTDFGDACEELSSQICLKFGDGEAVLDFDPAPPTIEGDGVGVSRDFVALSCNAGAHEVRGDRRLYDGGFCPDCENGVGKRTDVPRLLKEVPDGDVGILWGSCATLVSDDFLNILSDEERSLLRLIPTERVKPGKKKFYELVGDAIATRVGILGSKLVVGDLECERCGFFSDPWPEHANLPTEAQVAIARADLPSKLPSFFVVGQNGGNVEICMAKERWLEMRGKKGAKKALGAPLVLLSECFVDRQPKRKIVNWPTYEDE